MSRRRRNIQHEFTHYRIYRLGTKVRYETVTVTYEVRPMMMSIGRGKTKQWYEFRVIGTKKKSHTEKEGNL